MKHTKRNIIIAVIIVLGLAIYYYVALPALNIHSKDTWGWIVVALLVILIISIIKSFPKGHGKIGIREAWASIKASKYLKGTLILIAAIALFYIVGVILSSTLVNAGKYHNLLAVNEDGDFAEDVSEISFDKIPLLDRASATLLGNRKMGTMLDMVSQYEVDNLYSQINYKDTPVRVSPLCYANIIKWITNYSKGIPAYIEIDMATQNTSLIKLDQGMKYMSCEHFHRNIYRHLRFHYPTYIFDELSFEIDEEGTPYWICPVKKYNIGLFGGATIGRVVICNAVTGEMTDYELKDVPQWVDRAYTADLLVQLYDYYGTLKHGFFNSILGQKDCLRTTNGYNFLALDDDVWVYTGVTSVSGDQSNVGFVIMNQRTGETNFYKCEGAIEDSAMDSAEGQVQNLKYVATFPLLLNISGQPTYFMALKDDAGLVKKYAMVNVQKYQWVAIGDTVNACQEDYQRLMLTNGITEEAADTREELQRSGYIEKIAIGDIEGNTHYYLILQGSDDIFDVLMQANLDVIRYETGDRISLKYKENIDVNTVTEIIGGN